MATFTETKEYDKIEIVGEFKTVQVREATIIKKDGVEVSRTFHRFALPPGNVSIGTEEWTDTDISGATDEIKAICAAVWTDAVKAGYKAHMIEVNKMATRDPSVT